VSDESDNLVIRHLQEVRTDMKTGFGRVDARFDEVDERFVKVEASLADVRGVVGKTSSDVVAIARRLDEVDNDIRLA
jgi:hypothetical protein